MTPLDDTTLRDLIEFRDEQGVLSFYVGITPDQAADPQPTTPLVMRNQIKDLRQRLADAPKDQARAVEQRLESLEHRLERLMDPKAHGRGRALFVAVSDGREAEIALQMPFEERVVLHDTPYIRPLVAAHDEGRSAGILVVHQKGARVLEWAVGEAEELDSQDFELTDAQTADVKSGPSPSNPAHPGAGLVNKERYEDRVDENRHRFMKQVIADVGDLVRDRGWDRLLVAGSPKIRDEVAESIGAGELRVLVADHSWESTGPAQIADQAWPLLRSVHRQREQELVATAVDRAMSSNGGALGLRKVCEALNQGRVAHLLFQTDLEAEGYVGPEGTLHADVAGPAAQAGVELAREPLFVERMVERAFATGGRATPCDEEAAGDLGPHGGVAALLRW